MFVAPETAAVAFSTPLVVCWAFACRPFAVAAASGPLLIGKKKRPRRAPRPFQNKKNRGLWSAPGFISFFVFLVCYYIRRQPMADLCGQVHHHQQLIWL